MRASITNSRIALFLLGAALSILPTSAQESAEAAPSNQTAPAIPDYSVAFQKLLDLGIPNSKGSTYVNATFADKVDQYNYERYALNRKGNAWLMPDNTIIHDQFRTSKIAVKKKRNFLARLVSKEDTRSVDGVRKATWKEVDPTKEAAKILKQLNSEKLSNIFDVNQWSYDQSAAPFLGKILIFACHLHQHGETALANEIAHTVLQKAPYSFKVIDGIVDPLASHEYKTSTDSFFQSKDSKSYLVKLKELEQKYPRGWNQQPALSILIPQIENAALNGPSEITSYKGLPLDPKLSTHLEELLNFDGTHIQGSLSSSWLINPDKSQTRNIAPWSADFIQTGMASLPTLISASADESLIAARFQNRRTNYDSYNYDNFNSYNSSSSSSPAQTAYSNIIRPCTRGELVRALLSQTLPSSDTNWSTLPPDEFQASANQWYQKNFNKSPYDLAKVFLTEGSQPQQNVAIKALLTFDNPEAYPLIESHLLKGNPQSNINSVTLYLQKRKGEGKEFYQKYHALLESYYSDSYGDPDYAKKQLKRLTSPLEVLVNDLSAEQLIEDVLSGKREAQETYAMIKVSLGEATTDEEKFTHLETILSYLSKLKEPSDRLHGLNELQKNFRNSSEEKTRPEFQQTARAIFPSHLELWKPFLAKTSTDLQLEESVKYGAPPTESHFAANCINNIYYPQDLSGLYDLNTIANNQESWDFILTRIQTLVNTGTPTPFPTAEDLTPERSSEIFNAIKDLPSSEIYTYRENLTFSEQLSLNQQISELTKLPANILGLQEICQKIDWSYSTTIPLATRTAIEKLILGKAISRELIESLLPILKKQNNSFTIYFRKAKDTSGPNILTWLETGDRAWSKYYLEKQLSELTKSDHTGLTGLVTFGFHKEEDQAPDKASYFTPKDDGEITEEAKKDFNNLLTKSIPLFDIEPSKDEDNNSEREREIGFAIVTIIAADFQKNDE